MENACLSYANSTGSDQTPHSAHSAASDPSLYCLSSFFIHWTLSMNGLKIRKSLAYLASLVETFLLYTEKTSNVK